MQRLSEEAGEYKVGLTVISDAQGLSLKHFSSAAIATAQKRTRLEEDHYPESAKRCVRSKIVGLPEGPGFADVSLVPLPPRGLGS